MIWKSRIRPEDTAAKAACRGRPAVQRLSLKGGCLQLTRVCLCFSLWVLIASSGAAQQDWQPARGPLMTRWAGDVKPDSVLPEYPRPQMVRKEWMNLNGLWEYAILPEQAGRPSQFHGQILVPFPVESALSGVMKRIDEKSRLWYRRTFEVPAGWHDRRLLLHFGAVDWEATVFLNGHEIGAHRGGYDPFSFDITDALRPSGKQELVVGVFDPSDAGSQPTGKQVQKPQGIWYTPCSGIWQTVWMEPVAASHMEHLQITPDVDGKAVRFWIEGSGLARGFSVEAEALDDQNVVGRATVTISELELRAGAHGLSLVLPLAHPKLWSPGSPFLYRLRVSVREGGRVIDMVDSYFAMRKVAVGRDKLGVPRLLLNDEFVFQVGVMDQGYWPDGIYTAPSDEAIRYDIEVAKKLGFNVIRKHIKVEPERWYYWADKLGMLVWQDMPSCRASARVTPEWKRNYELELKAMIRTLYNHPSVIVWILFIEGWGQHDVSRYVRLVRETDSTRVIDATSGGVHDPSSDVLDVHRFPGPVVIRPDDHRAAILGSSGGLGLPVPGHLWSEGSWGYQVAASPEELVDLYERKIGRMWRAKDSHGMSAVGYVQLTDVETEANGFMTYDRAVIKWDVERVASVNQGRTPFIAPEDNRRFVDVLDVEIFCGAPSAEVRYTLDGAEPGASSRLYTGPFQLTETTIVKARCFREGLPIGAASYAKFEKTGGRDPVPGEDFLRGVDYRYFAVPYREGDGYQGYDLMEKWFEGLDNPKPFKTGTIKSLELTPREHDLLFFFEFGGYIRAPRDGVYRFTILADDGVLLKIHDQVVIRGPEMTPELAESSGAIPLKAGLHPFTLRYGQGFGSFGLEVLWEGPGIKKQPLPASALYRSPTSARPEAIRR